MNKNIRFFSGLSKEFPTILFFLIPLFTLLSCGVESGRFKISGRFLNMDQGEFYVYSPDGAIEGIDTIHVVGGHFTYERAIEREATLMLVFPNFSEQPIFAQSGKSVEIKADASHIKEMEVTGTKDNELMTKFRKQTANSSPPDVLKKAEELINDNPSSPIGGYLVRKYYLQTPTPDYTKAEKLVAKMLESQPKNGSLILLRKQLSQLKNGVEGASLPAFSAVDIDGNAVSDKDLGDDIGIVYVWSSWNFESQELQRQVKRQKQRAEGRIKVVGICLDADKKSCSDILKRDSITWPVVFDGKLFDSPTFNKLGLSNVPDNIVIDRHRIVGRSLNVPKLTEKLNQLTGK